MIEKEKSREERFLDMAKRADEGWKLREQLMDEPVRPMKALWFFEEDLEKVGEIIHQLEAQDLLGLARFPHKRRPVLRLREKFFPKLLLALNKEWISYCEIPTISISGMPVEDQRILRNRKGR